MPWFPDLEAARQLYPRHPKKPAERLLFYEGIQTRDTATLAASFDGQPDIDDPRVGHIDDIGRFSDYVSRVREWLDTEVTATEAVALTHGDDRSIEEAALRLASGETIGVAIATDFAPNGKMQRVRVYYARA
jgi:hypothetical protein